MCPCNIKYDNTIYLGHYIIFAIYIVASYPVPISILTLAVEVGMEIGTGYEAIYIGECPVFFTSRT